MNFSDSFRAARWMRFINLLLQAVLFLTLFAGLNYVALNHSWRYDITRDRQHTLSAETISYLERLERPVTITVTITNDERADEEVLQAFRDISALLREYVYQTSTPKNALAKIEVNFLDVYKNGREAEKRGIEQANVVVLESDHNRRVLTLGDFYRTKDRRREAFQGEATLTAAILDVSSPDKKKIYFVSGHGEMSPADTSAQRGLSQLRGELIARNFDVSQLDLSLTRSIPANEDPLLIVASPQRRFQPYEEELLRNYLTTRAGRVILLLDPRQPAGLENLLFDWGVLVYDKVIIDPSPRSISETNDLIFWHFARDDESNITNVMRDNGLSLYVGETLAVSDDLGRPADDGLRVTKLVGSSAEAWGETNYRARTMPEYTPGQDLRGEIGAMVISERLKPANNLPFSVRGGRLAVFGTSSLASNNRISVGGNLNFLLATINWTVDRDAQVSVPVRPIQRFSLAMSQESLLRLRLGLFLIVPGIVAAIGLIVYWTRRD